MCWSVPHQPERVTAKQRVSAPPESGDTSKLTLDQNFLVVDFRDGHSSNVELGGGLVPQSFHVLGDVVNGGHFCNVL